jgi:Fic family protein
MAKYELPQQILEYLQQQLAAGVEACRPEDITANVDASRPTVNRYLVRMATTGVLRKVGSGPATRYALPAIAAAPAPAGVLEVAQQPPLAPLGGGFQFSVDRQPLIAELTAPIGTRKPVTYQRAFVDNYVPNQTMLLPPALAEKLFAQGRARGQQPAGTYARKVLEQLLIDLSWHSSRLEGNRKSLLDTKELFARGHADEDDIDAVMLFNHKDAIEFVVDAVPEYGITEAVVRNIQAMLMQGLLTNPDALGKARRTVVTITDSVYVPMQMPQVLDEMLALLVDKVRNIKNPIEAAFFVWMNIAYLQPFEDGNKRTSRLCANLPLLLQNCAPLSFLDVEQADYALAVLGVYEKQDVSLAVELFDWTYRRSIDKYGVILDAMGAPDLFRQKYRELLGEGVRRVVVDGASLEAAVKELAPPTEDLPAYLELLRQELQYLEPFNCARYRLGIRLTEGWIMEGRPGL